MTEEIEREMELNKMLVQLGTLTFKDFYNRVWMTASMNCNFRTHKDFEELQEVIFGQFSEYCKFILTPRQVHHIAKRIWMTNRLNVLVEIGAPKVMIALLEERLRTDNFGLTAKDMLINDSDWLANI